MVHKRGNEAAALFEVPVLLSIAFIKSISFILWYKWYLRRYGFDPDLSGLFHERNW
jgi:hypothetical protein